MVNKMMCFPTKDDSMVKNLMFLFHVQILPPVVKIHSERSIYKYTLTKIVNEQVKDFKTSIIHQFVELKKWDF